MLYCILIDTPTPYGISIKLFFPSLSSPSQSEKESLKHKIDSQAVTIYQTIPYILFCAAHSNHVRARRIRLRIEIAKQNCRNWFVFILSVFSLPLFFSLYPSLDLPALSHALLSKAHFHATFFFGYECFVIISAWWFSSSLSPSAVHYVYSST